MTNPSKKKGTRAEVELLKVLEKIPGVIARRQPLNGKKDLGDLVVIKDNIHFVIEVKAGKQTAAPGRIQFKDWCKQSIAEKINYSRTLKPDEPNLVVPVLIIRQYRARLQDCPVFITNNPMNFFFFDQFIEVITTAHTLS